MELTLILGPMKSGKSFDLISCFAPLKYTTIPFALYQSARNVRDEQICSRNGVVIAAKKAQSLKEALAEDCSIIGIDELHMFPEEDAKVIEELVKRGTKVIAAGLDTDYQGKMFGIIKRLLELGPREVRFKRAVCENCKKPDAVYTQVFKDSLPITAGMPPVIPDDGTFSYRPSCRDCFVK